MAKLDSRIDNFVEVVIEEMDNALMNMPEANSFINEGGIVEFRIDKTGTTIRQGVKK